MPESNVLDLDDIWDESRRIRPVFTPRDPSSPIPHGRYRAFDDEGRLRVELTYSNGVVHGHYHAFWSNGQIASDGEFENGARHGLWKFYNKDGTLFEIIRFENGKEFPDEKWRQESI